MSVSKELKVYYNLGKAEEEKANFKTIKFDDIAEPTLEYLIPLALKEYDIDAAEESNYLLRYVNKKLFFKDANEAITAQDVLLVNALDEAKEAVAEIETIVEELYQNYSLKTMKDLFSKKEISIESKNFLNEITKNFEMQLDVYVEEFIRLGGSNQLMSLAVLIDGSTLGCCLKMFYVTTIYLNGVKFLKQRPENISKLYNLLEKDELTVKKNTLGILWSLLRDMDGAFAIINKAAVAHGLKNQRSPYSPLVEALATKDLELKERVLHFFNWMIFKCPKEELWWKFQSRLENLGVFEECQKIVKVSNPKLRKQLMLFQQNNNVIIKSSMYELEIHRNRIIELERNWQSFEKKLSSLQEQQNFYGSKLKNICFIILINVFYGIRRLIITALKINIFNETM